MEVQDVQEVDTPSAGKLKNRWLLTAILVVGLAGSGFAWFKEHAHAQGLGKQVASLESDIEDLKSEHKTEIEERTAEFLSLKPGSVLWRRSHETSSKHPNAYARARADSPMITGATLFRMLIPARMTFLMPLMSWNASCRNPKIK